MMIALKVGMEPDGFLDWLKRDAEEKAQKKAAKAGTGVVQVAPPAAAEPAAAEPAAAESPRSKVAKLVESASPGRLAAALAALAK